MAHRLDAGEFFPPRDDPAGSSRPRHCPNNLKRRIIDYLCPSQSNAKVIAPWHSSFILNNASYGFFVAKAMAILHEMALLGALESAGFRVLDLRVLRLLQRCVGHRPRTAGALIRVLDRWRTLQLGAIFYLRRLLT